MEDMRNDRSVSAIEFLGFGRSLRFRVPDREYGVSLFMRQVEDVRRELGWERMILAGVSMGGWVATQYALDYPDRAAGLLLMSAAGMAPEVPESELRKTLHDFDFRTPDEFRRFINTYMVYQAVVYPGLRGPVGAGSRGTRNLSVVPEECGAAALAGRPCGRHRKPRPRWSGEGRTAVSVRYRAVSAAIIFPIPAFFR